MKLQDFLSRLDHVRKSGDEYTARCPAHDDHSPSLSIREGLDGRILVNCFNGCSAESITRAMGLSMQDLYPEPERQVKPQLEAQFLYAGGMLKKEKYRRPDGSKHCIWKHLEGDVWKNGRNGIQPGIYGAENINYSIFFLVEGEKDVDNLRAIGIDAVSLPDGAQSKWDPAYEPVFRDKQVVILPDNDEPGHAYAQNCARQLHGLARDIWILDLKEVWQEIPEKGDISDLILAFGGDEAMKRVMKGLDSTPKWEPEPVQEQKGLICAADVDYTPPQWLIAPYFQRGKGTLIQADPGTGKTAFICAVAAAVTTGRGLIDLPVQSPGNVLMLSVEDDLGILRGRISANQGDPEKVFFLQNAADLNLNSPEVEEAIQKVQAKLVIFDPLQAFLGAKIDMFRANETRPALAKLFQMCKDHDCACAIISHMGKSGMGKSPVNQSLGSVDIPAAMRSVLHIARNPGNPDECVAVHVKSSNAPRGKSIAYTIGDMGRVEWKGFCDLTVEDLTPGRKGKEETVYEQEPLVQLFNRMITDRPEGAFWSYSETAKLSQQLLGSPQYASSLELRRKLSGKLSRELIEKDGIQVTVGEKQNGNRGIRVEKYQHPAGYQTRMQI